MRAGGFMSELEWPLPNERWPPKLALVRSLRPAPASFYRSAASPQVYSDQIVSAYTLAFATTLTWCRSDRLAAIPMLGPMLGAGVARCEGGFGRRDVAP